jgi:hypothetical protein
LVLQPASLEPLEPGFEDTLSRFEALASASGVPVLVWAPWARDPSTDVYGVYDEPWSGGSYEALTRNLQVHVSDAVTHADVAPIGDLWQLARRAHPDWVLHSSKDGNHSTYLGAYLAALLLYGYIYDVSPETALQDPRDPALEIHRSARSLATAVWSSAPQHGQD